jgi:hypothetical protein
MYLVHQLSLSAGENTNIFFCGNSKNKDTPPTSTTFSRENITAFFMVSLEKDLIRYPSHLLTDVNFPWSGQRIYSVMLRAYFLFFPSSYDHAVFFIQHNPTIFLGYIRTTRVPVRTHFTITANPYLGNAGHLAPLEHLVGVAKAAT